MGCLARMCEVRVASCDRLVHVALHEVDAGALQGQSGGGDEPGGADLVEQVERLVVSTGQPERTRQPERGASVLLAGVAADVRREALDRIGQVAEAHGELGPLELERGELLSREGSAAGELQRPVDLLARRAVGVQGSGLAGDVVQGVDRTAAGVGLVQVVGDRRVATPARVHRCRLPRIGDGRVQALAVAAQ